MATKSGEIKTPLIDIAKSRLSLGKKFIKKWQSDVKKWLKDYEVDSLDSISSDSADDLHNVLQIPYIFSTIESDLPSMFDTVPSLIMTQRGKRDRDFTDWTDRIWKYLQDILQLSEKIEDAGFMFLVAGMGVGKYGWTTKTEKVTEPQEVPMTNSDGSPAIDPTTGEPITQTIEQEFEVPVVDRPWMKIEGYEKVYFSPESEFITDDEENKIPWIICQEKKTPDEVEEEFGTKLGESSLTQLDLKEFGIDNDDDADVNGLVKDDLKRVNLYRYYGVLPRQYGDKDWSSDSVYYFVFTSGRVIKKPVKTGKKPFVLMGNYGVPSKFFKFGEPKVLRELEQDVSLGRSMIIDYRDKFATKIAVPVGTEYDEHNLMSPKKHMTVKFNGQTFPQYISPPPLPETILTALQQSRDDIQMTSAQLDISRGGDQNVVKTATGQRIFQMATEKRINRKRRKVARFIRAMAKNLLTMCANNWDVDTFAKITDLDPMQLQQLGYVDSLKKLGDEFDIEIDIEDISNNKESKSAQAIAFYDKTIQDPSVNHAEVLKFVMEVGFQLKDWERFINPIPMIPAIDQPGTEGQVGRPGEANPVDILNKAMPGADANQINAQNAAAYKQTGVPKTQNA